MRDYSVAGKVDRLCADNQFPTRLELSYAHIEVANFRGRSQFPLQLIPVLYYGSETMIWRGL